MNTRVSHLGLRVTRGQVIGGSLAGLLVAALLATAVHYAPPLLAGPALTQLVISGQLEHVQPQAVQSAVRAALGSGFFSTQVDKVQSAVAALPWVASVSVRRSWPHTVYVDITEEQPLVRWNGDGLMDAQGRVFVHSGAAAWNKLPILNGSEGSEQDVLAEYRSFEALLAPRSLELRQLTVDARGDASLQLANGLEVRLGRDNAELRLERFISVALPMLTSQLANVVYVDMRYTNGFAVGWSRMISATCQWHVVPSKRRHMDVAAGRPAMDGSRDCTSTCAAADQRAKDGSQGTCAATTEVRPNG
ncbi:MAG: cell division protein FtsQ/DivIB [Gammaproteobacteria bacterium]|nr:cell division protein FtsQ/DivIB [Gammaproteobacteria bacterium]